jgi:thioredoxin fold protein
MSTAKTILSLSAISLMAIVLLSGCLSNSSKDGKMDEQKSGEIEDHVEVLYFHGKAQCITCRAIEKFASEAIDSVFADEVKLGRVSFRVIDIDENEELANDYQTTWSSLFVTTFKNGEETRENLTEFGFSTARNNHDVFQDSLIHVIRNSLNRIE